MATAEVFPQSRAQVLSLRWIISARDDLVWFIGSVASSYALLILYVAGVLPLIPMVALWAILIDAPHVFGTFSRTYFDRAERRNRARLLWGSLLFFVVGPIMVLAGLGLVFFFLAALWAYYHLVKQHYGFMVLYKKKNNDLAPVDNALDRLLLLFAFNYPFVAFIARDPEAMTRVPASLRFGVNGLATILLAGTIILFVAWLLRQLQRFVGGEALDVPKYLLLVAAIPMHWIVLLTPMPNKPIAIVAILTIYHNLQYHRLIWFHNKKYKAGSADILSAATRRSLVESMDAGSADLSAATRHSLVEGMDAGSADILSAATRRSLVESMDAEPERQSLSALDGGKATFSGSAEILGSSPTVSEGLEPIQDPRQKFGAAELISRRLLYYIAFGILFGIIYQGPRQYLGYVNLKNGGGITSEQSFAMQLGISFLWGYAFIHYYLDSKIWRVRRDPSVGKALNMA